MKKMMLMVGVLMMAVLVFGAGSVKWDATQDAAVVTLLKAKDFKGAKALLDTIDWQGKPDLGKYCWAEFGVKPVISLDDAQSRVNAIAVQIGVTRKPSIDWNIMAGCRASKLWADVLKISVKNEDYAAACQASVELKDNVACFTYAKKALLGKPTTAPQVIEVLANLADMDFSDTTVTKAMQIDFLQSVNAKYSRFLITDKATWEPVIANIRTTLEGYGVK